MLTLLKVCNVLMMLMQLVMLLFRTKLINIIGTQFMLYKPFLIVSLLSAVSLKNVTFFQQGRATQIELFGSVAIVLSRSQIRRYVS